MGTLKALFYTLMFFSVIHLAGCDFLARDWAPDKLGKLAIKLEGKYRREFYYNKYSIHYKAVKPNIILINVKHYPEMDILRLRRIVRDAERLVYRVARKEFKMNIVVKTKIREVKKR